MPFIDQTKKLVPINIRQFLSHLSGSSEPLTEFDLDPTDLASIRRAIERDRKRHGKDSGVIGYGDYAEREGELPDFDPSTSAASIVKNSFTNPAFRMETTLGMAKWRLDKEGNAIVEDTYRFDASRKNVDAIMQDQGMSKAFVGAYKYGGMVGLLNALGNTFGSTQDEKGTAVKINVGSID